MTESADGAGDLAEILRDRVSGASEVESRLLTNLESLTESDRSGVLESLPGRLLETFPQMANLRSLAEELRELAKEPASTEAVRAFVSRRAAEKALRELRLSHVVTPLLPSGDLLVFTLSKSGTVMAVITDLVSAGRNVTVLVAESRPGGEGARFARELVAKGVKCRTCDDFLLLSLVPKEAASRRPPGYSGSPVVLVGADGVHPDALVNKIGTRALLETARLAEVPAFVLASSTKIRNEISPRVLGSLFEAIPRSGTLVVSELGVLAGGAP